MIVRFWLLELAGWAVMLLGLFIFYYCFVLLLSEPPRLLSATPLTFVGFVVFRGGIHLMKVAVAARICLYAQQQATTTRDDGRKGRRG